MKKHLIVCLFILIEFIPFKSFSSTFTVKKAKGNSAIIESSIPLEEGQTYTLESDQISEDPVYANKNTSRKNSFTLGANFSMIKASELQENIITLEGRYGWNLAKYEFGPIVSLQMVDEGAGFNTLYAIGGYGDYNITPNRNNDTLIFGGTLQATAGNQSTTAGANSQIITIDGGAFLTWFLFKSSTALRTEALFETKKISTDRTNATANGFRGKLFLSFYF